MGLLVLKFYTGGHGEILLDSIENAGCVVFDHTCYTEIPKVELITAFKNKPPKKVLDHIADYLRHHGDHSLGRRHVLNDYTVLCKFRIKFE